MKADVAWGKGRCCITLQAETKKDVIALMWVASTRREETHDLIMALSCRNYGWQPRKYMVGLEARRKK